MNNNYINQQPYTMASCQQLDSGTVRIHRSRKNLYANLCNCPVCMIANCKPNIIPVHLIKPVEQSAADAIDYASENVYEHVGIPNGTQLQINDATIDGKAKATNTTENAFADIKHTRRYYGNGKQLNLFTQIIDTLRHKKKTIKTNRKLSKSTNIEIIHNVSGDVFKTNKTFDLNEICKLRAEYELHMNQVHSNNQYGKLRKSDDHLINNSTVTVDEQSINEQPDQMEQPLKMVSSESNFYWNSTDNLPLVSLLDSSSEVLSTDELIRRSSFTNELNDHAIYENVQQLHCTAKNSTKVNNLMGADNSDEFILSDSVKSWMTSLSQFTEDYNEHSLCTIKCIPSRTTSCYEPYNSVTPTFHTNGRRETLLSSNQVDIVQQLEIFRRNFIENQSKRRAIYVKSEKQLDPIIVLWRDSFFTAEDDPEQQKCIESDLISADNSLEQTIETSEYLNSEMQLVAAANVKPDENEYSINKTIHFVQSREQYSVSNNRNRIKLSGNRESANTNTTICGTVINLGSADDEKSNNEFSIHNTLMDLYRTSYVNRIVLATSLNRSVIVYDHYLTVFLNYVNNWNRLSNGLYLVNYYNIFVEIFHQLQEFLIEEHNNPKPVICIKRKKFIPIIRWHCATPLKVAVPNYNTHPLNVNPTDKISAEQCEKFQETEVELNVMQTNNTSNMEPCENLRNELITSVENLRDYSEGLIEAERSTTVWPEIRKNFNDGITDEEIHNKIGDVENNNVVYRQKQNRTDHIYQRIWNFQTVGNVRESYSSDTYDGLYDSVDHNRVLDEGDWLLVNEFTFSKEISEKEQSCTEDSSSSVVSLNLIEGEGGAIQKPFNNIDMSIDCAQSICNGSNEISDPYDSICILYNELKPNLNRIFYNYDKNYLYKQLNSIEQNQRDENIPPPLPPRKLDRTQPNSTLNINNHNKKLCTDSIIAPSVQAWKFLLLNINYLEDEEDVILTCQPITDSFLFSSRNKTASLYSSRGEQSLRDLEKFSVSTNDLSSLKLTDKPNTRSITPDPKGSNESSFSRFKSKLLPNNKGSISIETSQSYKNKPESFKNISENESADIASTVPQFVPGAIFGFDLECIERDSTFPNVPRFVVECVRIVEEYENLTTNGIYRASGNKNCIEAIRKHMNNSKKLKKKENRYEILKGQDIHTITGALKQFFRELKTSLVTEEFLKSLPNLNETTECLELIRNEIATIRDPVTKGTLKFVIKHLANVDANNIENLMTAPNLAIVWGPCLCSVQPLTMADAKSLEKSNMLTKILIKHYRFIFETDQFEHARL